MMDRDTLDLILPVMQSRGIKNLDLTGGAPELHNDFCYLVSKAHAAGMHVIDRCNLTILFEPGQEGLAEFLAEHQVEVVASLPCYSLENVDKQRGKGVFDKSIAGLQKLNALGYGKVHDDKPGSDLLLNLVYNPQGPSLPPNQQVLQADYKRELRAHFGIEFNQLYALANMPIKRFGSTLISKRQFHNYMQLLKDNFQQDNLEQVMCRSLVSVDWQGYLYDCDFNQQLALPLLDKSKKHLRDLLEHDLNEEPICVADHCFGCTAGQGSSCGGAL
jgi:radical SAM/Cys-rich protein